jgi:hypothetical protein
MAFCTTPIVLIVEDEPFITMFYEQIVIDACLPWLRVLEHRALFRDHRRGVGAPFAQLSNRRGAFSHRTHGASSQALERGPIARPQAR